MRRVEGKNFKRKEEEEKEEQGGEYLGMPDD